MTEVTSQPNSSLDRIINGLKEIERIADKNASTILYVTGMAILAVTYMADLLLPDSATWNTTNSYFRACSRACFSLVRRLYGSTFTG